MASLVLSVIGSDRPGLTERLAEAVLASGGNWLESHLSRLGGLYVGSVLVDVGPNDAERLRAAVAEIDAHGLEVRIAPAAPHAETRGDALQLNLVGQDRPGIVRQVTAILTGLNVNIETFETQLRAEPHAGGSLFQLESRLRLPPALRA
ncbi:MAG TPA: ACT domain-containing protein, partial [Caulobacteraceae bacterium]|nr:ACT domain-containing protein [Caulobacteraceae bacterium]